MLVWPEIGYNNIFAFLCEKACYDFKQFLDLNGKLNKLVKEKSQNVVCM